MQITDLANEILLQILQSAPTLPTLFALTSTCTHFHSLLIHHRLPTLYLVFSRQYGPLHDAIAIATHNASQPAHLPRPPPPQSLALLKRLLAVGRVAEKWVFLYPRLKWRGDDSCERRLLTSDEEWRLRRACYRIWLYGLAFHTKAFPRQTRLQPPIIRARALLLRPWPTQELGELLDLHAIFRHVLHSHVCPNNGTVLRRHRQRWPDDPLPLLERKTVGKMEQTSAGLSGRDGFHHSQIGAKVEWGKLRREKVEGWGDEISQYYVVEDMLKCHPGQLLWLFETVMGTGEEGVEGAAWDSGFNGGISGSKGVVEHFVIGLGEWFENNGETLVERVGAVVGDRGGDIGALMEGVEGGWEGIARREE